MFVHEKIFKERLIIYLIPIIKYIRIIIIKQNYNYFTFTDAFNIINYFILKGEI